MSDSPPPAAEADEPDEPPPEPKPKKKRRKSQPAAAQGAPQHEGLTLLIAAFDAGNYALVRREGPKLVRSQEVDADVRAAAKDLVRRIDPDPMSKWMMGGAGLLLAFLAGWYWTHAHGGP